MPVKIFSCLIQGIEGKLVEVEADIMSGLSAFTIVGLGDQSVQESKERIRSAIKNTSAKYPTQKKIINLAPASLKKNGPSFDLPIAVSLLAASGQIDATKLAQFLFIGELSLDGYLRPIANALSIAIFARENGWKRVYLPVGNYAEATLIGGIEIVPVTNLQELIWHLQKGEIIDTADKNLTFSQSAQIKKSNVEAAFNQIQGQEEAKRALQIAAAGGHHLLLYGPPGVGKTLLAKSLPELMPPLSEKEMLETMRIHSAAARLSTENLLIGERPFRQVHHTASLGSLTGGGVPIVPGEMSLANNGVLFLDELPEFPRSMIEALRQPLEEREIHLARQGQQVTFPCSFVLVVAMNPCPCGYFGDPEKACKCSPVQIKNYQNKISGPIFDRIDLAVCLPRIKINALNYQSQNSAELAAFSVSVAYDRQKKRFRNSSIKNNAELNSTTLKKYIQLDDSAEQYLKIIVDRTLLSARGQIQILKTALTIADLKNLDKISNLELAEAFQYKNSQLFA